MSVRVLNPVVFSEFYKLRSPSTTVGRNLPCGQKLNRIKRDLFGSPAPAETKKTFCEEIEKQQEKAASKWGFDFRSGHPLANSKHFVWERVACPEVMPEMYTLTRAAHVREAVDEETPISDMLLDKRAIKENSSIEDMICSLEEETETSIFKAPPTPLSCHKSLGKRQPKITEYMKERKRLAQTPKKVSPSKRQRLSSGSSSSSHSHSLRSIFSHRS